MNSRKYKSIVSLVRKRMSEVKSEEEIKLLTNVLDRAFRLARATSGDVDTLIELGEQILGTKND